MPPIKTKPKSLVASRLSMSSKLRIREAAADAVRLKNFLTCIPGQVLKKLNLDKFESEPPSPPPIDFTAPLPDLEKPRPGQERPIETSIVIPVFNKATFTFQCLRSLMNELDFSNTEIIVVDNASSDETDQVLKHFGSYVRVIRNETNKGFVDASNQGAEAARGEYLIFLNNDTKVMPGWLKHLLLTIESDSNVGAVGSMLVYPNGLIQEAGSIVWNKGEAHHYGWGAAPDDRRFNFAREVDYCSAASLLIRSDLFRQIGGFDRRYGRGYYEDIDLCFSVRSLGFKVMYQPMSRTVHYEGGTAGRNVAEGMKQLQIVNRETFYEKWHDVLEREHLPRDLTRIREAAHRLRPSSVIVFDERIPTPDRDAGSARMVWILKSLSKIGHVVFAPFYGGGGGPYEQQLWQAGIETADIADYRRLLTREGVIAAVVSRPNIAEAVIPQIRRVNKNLPVVFDTVDVHFLRTEREARVSGDAEISKIAQQYRELETRLARESDLIWCCSSTDKQVMETVAAGTPVEVIPTIHEKRPLGKPFNERADLLFVGNMAHRPNSDAVNFLITEIYPRLKELLPGVKLFIVGDNASPQLRSLATDHVKIMGYVPDIEPFFANCRVCLAPLRFGAGIKGKIGEAMAYGLPTVTTTIGAEGFGLTHGVDILIADEPQDFAAAVAGLYSDEAKWNALAANSRAHVEKNFTPEVIADAINNSILSASQRAGATSLV